MRCFHVPVEGRLTWLKTATDRWGATQPAGFFCTRYVFASDPETARRKAFERVRANIDKQFGWLANGIASVALDNDIIRIAPFWKALKPDNKGHTFYLEA